MTERIAPFEFGARATWKVDGKLGNNIRIVNGELPVGEGDVTSNDLLTADYMQRAVAYQKACAAACSECKFARNCSQLQDDGNAGTFSFEATLTIEGIFTDGEKRAILEGAKCQPELVG